MMQQVHILFADFIEVVNPLDFHRFGFYPLAIENIAALCRNFPNVDFRIEVGCERITMVTAVAVQNINFMDFIEIMLLCIGTEYTRYAWVETAAQQGCNASLFKAFPICPLPLVFKLCRVFRLIVCGVHIVYLGCKASIHNGQILIRQRHIDDNIRLFLFNQGNQFVNLVCIHLCGGDNGLCTLCFYSFLQGITLRLGTAGNADFCKDFAVLAALVHNDTSNAACSDN